MELNVEAGGPAFPIPAGSSAYDGRPNHSHGPQVGMSLRDWFAGKALTGMMSIEDSRLPMKDESVDEWRKRIAIQDAEACYRYADAMLLARKVKDNGPDQTN